MEVRDMAEDARTNEDIAREIWAASDGDEVTLYGGPFYGCAGGHHPGGALVEVGDGGSRRLLLNGRGRTLFEGRCRDYDGHPEGALVDVGGGGWRIELHDGSGAVRPVYEGPCGGWRGHPEGAVIRRNGRLFLAVCHPYADIFDPGL